MKKNIANILTILIFISCSSSKEVSSIISIDKKVQRIEKKIFSLNKTSTPLYNDFYATLSENDAISYFSKKLKILKIEYDIHYYGLNMPTQNKDNIEEFKRMGFSDGILRREGAIYFSNGKPILIKETIKRELTYWFGGGKNIKTGEFQNITQETNNDNDFKIYILNWDKSEIVIENLFGSLSKSDFNQSFYNDIIEELKKSE